MKEHLATDVLPVITGLLTVGIRNGSQSFTIELSGSSTREVLKDIHSFLDYYLSTSEQAICRGCGGQEPAEVLRQMDGYCSSQCEREHKEE